MTYERLTGGSGIQWPCTKDYPFGKERLFEDGHFFTDIEYCESYGHDLETSSPLYKEQYDAINPRGRAILKSCNYIPDADQPNDEYPLRLSTGRNIYHFHTRTKTGRSQALRDANPEPVVSVNANDAAKLGISEGEDVLVRSTRGSVQLKASIGRVSKGQIFIPFHFGYFDSSNEKARAANELTTGKQLEVQSYQHDLTNSRALGSRLEAAAL